MGALRGWEGWQAAAGGIRGIRAETEDVARRLCPVHGAEGGTRGPFMDRLAEGARLARPHRPARSEAGSGGCDRASAVRPVPVLPSTRCASTICPREGHPADRRPADLRLTRVIGRLGEPAPVPARPLPP